MDIVVPIGAFAVSAGEGETLACLGLGSCVALALWDRHRAVAGLAHIMLPAAPAATVARPWRYADLAVPALLAALARAGAEPERLEAVLAGGAAMFGPTGSGRDIGAQNAQAVAEALAGHAIPVRGEALGGRRGRSLRLVVSPAMRTVVRESGGREVLLFGEDTPVAA